ncbi:DEAD/DEAH box helicase family protein [Kurthia massiliensis]|uniref:DEAD/DEAH box helicase family protein n=1 Tax=Kurthia massiliensis TaxID=1033739 RepID=UPI000288D498|nr:DEAD/DEAH box helicase family protein [Kurthia massiliensis]
MSLVDLQLKYKYRSDQEKLYEDFYEKCLRESIYYDRAAGYFTSHSLKLIARGLEYFLHNGGQVRIIANPYLDTADIEMIALGYEAKYRVVEKNILNELELTAENIEGDTLNVLAWLIYEGRLDIKIAFTENHSLYHEKFGLFKDAEGNTVLFAGSANETVGGMAENFERVDVFLPPHDQHRIQSAEEDFENLWNDETNGLIVKEIDAQIKQYILSHRDVTNRPSIQNLKRKGPKPRAYQLTAIEALVDNNWRGILEMATGTGKTITSLLAMQKYLDHHGRIFCVIIAPFKHLVDQWQQECSKFNIDFPILCYESTAKWKDTLNTAVRNFNLGISDAEAVITTYDTAMNPLFYETIQKIQRNSFLIADECHYMGAAGFRHLPYDHITARLGLSATPDRWWDDDGTQFLKDYFQDVIYQYTLDEAIEANKLTPYQYFPQVVHLTEDELERYNMLTHKIIQHFNSTHKDDEMLSVLNRRRAKILSKAEQKIPRLLALLKQKEVRNIAHTIVYCAEGQVNELTRALSDLDLRVHKFDSTVPNKQRQHILQRFAAGEIQVLVAIKCLDEGVDVPSTKTAYFLASTSNPREFVQRRGRILRKYQGKVFAEIYDFITFPIDVDDATFTSVAKKELPRFAEFANSSISPSQAKNTIMPYISPYNLNHLMDMKPWDVYRAMKEVYDTNDQ